MISCYVLSILTFGMLLTLAQQSFPLTFLILTSIVYCFTETLIIFFFVGTGVSVRDYSNENHLADIYKKNSLKIKFRLYPPTMLNILLMIVMFILPGAVDAGKIPAMVFYVFFVICLAHYIYTKMVQHECFRENTNNILAMSGITRAA